MRPEQHASRAVARVRPAGTGARHWRVLLEARWRARLQEVTELSLAYHGAAAADPDGRRSGRGEREAAEEAHRAADEEAERLLRSTVAARRKLADVEEALARLTAGTFGECEECGSAIPARLLAVRPETRYCPRCDASPAPAPVLVPARPQRHLMAGRSPA